MPGLAALALPDKDRSRIRIEIANTQATELAISATGKQSGLDEIPEIALRGINQPAHLVLCEIAQSRRLDLAKRLHRPPCGVRGNLAVPESLV